MYFASTKRGEEFEFHRACVSKLEIVDELLGDALELGLGGDQTHFAKSDLFDADNDGDLDLFVANGCVWPQAEEFAGGTWYA